MCVENILGCQLVTQLTLNILVATLNLVLIRLKFKRLRMIIMMSTNKLPSTTGYTKYKNYSLTVCLRVIVPDKG